MTRVLSGLDACSAGPTRLHHACSPLSGKDPVDEYIIVPAQPGCIDVRELNIDPGAETDAADSEDAPTTGGDESGGSSGDESGGSELEGDAGCGCRSNAAPGGSLAPLALVLAAVRPPRRARAGR